MLATKFESNHVPGLLQRAEIEPSDKGWKCWMPTTSTGLTVGTTGEVGSMLIPPLCEDGVQVGPLVRDETEAQPLRDQGVEMVFGDLDRPETLDAAVDGAAKVYLITWNGPTGVTRGHNLITAALARVAPTSSSRVARARHGVGSWSTSCAGPVCHTRC